MAFAKKLSTGLLLILAMLAGGVLGEPLIKFKTISKTEGLASTVVYDIAQDKDGFMWFATEDGLQRYDGLEFVTYRYNRLDSASLSNNHVRVLLIDKAGLLWVGTNDGLNLYNKKHDNFIRFSEDSPAERQINSGQIRSLYQTSDGKIWIGTSAGLNIYDKQKKYIEQHSHSKVRAILEDERKQIWIGSLYDGFHQFDRRTKKFKRVNLFSDIVNTKAQSPKNFSVVDIYRDNFGRVFVATWGDGLFILKRDSNRLDPVPFELPSKKVRTVLQDKNGYFWFGTNQGLYVVEPSESKAQLIEAFDRNDASLPVDNVFKIFQSNDDTLWFGTYGGGVSRHFPNSRNFETYGIHPNSSDGLIDPVVYSINENAEGDIWIGTETGKVSKFDPESKTFTHYEFKIEGIENKDYINDIVHLNEQYLLIGTSLNLTLYDHINQTSYLYTESDNALFSNEMAVRFIYHDSKNRIWIGVDNKGVKAFYFQDNKLQALEESYINLKHPKSMVETGTGSILIADMHDGVYKLNTDGEPDRYQYSLIENTKNLNIVSVNEDWKQNIWISTSSNGIRILGKKGNIVELDESNKLPNNTVYSVVPDITSQQIWASTNVGLIAIDSATLDVSVYDSSDGLQGDEFNKPGILSKSGYLYFGGVSGFNRFYPNIIEKKLYVAKPRITNISIANKPLNLGKKNKAANDWDNQKLVELSYKQTPLTIHYTSPQFIKPKALEFKHRLIGLSEEWVMSNSNIRQATFTNLDPGEYTFQLKVREAGGTWIDASDNFKINILPPWWLNATAKSLYLFLTILFVSFVSIVLYKKRKKEINIQIAIKENEERLKLSLWGSGHEFWDWNIETGEMSRSNEFKKIQIDCPKLSKNLNELASYIHPSDLQMVKEKLSNHIAGNINYFDISYRILDSDNGWRWIQDRGKVVAFDSQGNALRMSGTQRDITDIREKEAQFEMLGQAFKSTSDGVWIRDHEWRLVECNPAFERITGFSIDEKKGEALWFPDYQDQPENLLQRIHISIEEKGNWQGEVWAERKNNDPFPQKLSIDTLHDEKGNIRYYVGVFSDITFHKRTEEEFRKLANYDSLTGLPNRACLYDRLNQTIEKAKRDKSRFALFLVDVDNFKRINDSLGHNVGDHLIKQVASRLVNCNKEGDTVARVGGDEFVIVIENVRSSSSVATFSELLLKELNQPIFVKGQKLKLNFSIGITLAPDDAIIPERLLRNADTAMYEAKKSVENSYRFYSVEFNERARKRLAMETALRKAIDDETIELFYQPKIDLNTGRVNGVEALARWTHKELGFISPGEFIPLAEETGLIVPLGAQLLRQAIRQTKEWVDAGVMRGRTAINLSANQFWNRNLAVEVSEILKEEGLDAKFIELEITESACMQDIQETLKQIEVLKQLGFSLALDDFGTGYSSLAQLKTLPFDTIKVDKSFVDNIETNKQDAKVVKAVIDIAKTMEMEVVIEGVESKTQCEYLWMNRAYIVQGFYFSRPIRGSLCPEIFNRHWHKQEYLSKMAVNVTPLG
ncbi:EAL domain-containing protein [Aliikangiella marina]|nr:EAL domain-containing protein [Aliikangiella marina]